MSKQNYITRHYAILTYGLCILSVVALGISSWITFNTEIKQLSYGILILLFADVILSVLFLVSMVAMFREVSRLHARQFPTDMIDQMTKIGNQLEQMSNDFKAEKNHIEKITSLPNVYTRLKESVDIDIKFDGIISQCDSVIGSRNKKIKDIVNSIIKKFKSSSHQKKDPSEPSISPDTPAETGETDSDVDTNMKIDEYVCLSQ